MPRTLLAAALGLLVAFLIADGIARAGLEHRLAFACRPRDDGRVTCDTAGDDGRRPPDWYVADPDGRVVDRASGRYAVDLWPTLGVRTEIVVRLYPRGRGPVQLRCHLDAKDGCSAGER